jgi:hypothetical protein
MLYIAVANTHVPALQTPMRWRLSGFRSSTPRTTSMPYRLSQVDPCCTSPELVGLGLRQRCAVFGPRCVMYIYCCSRRSSDVPPLRPPVRSRLSTSGASLPRRSTSQCRLLSVLSPLIHEWKLPCFICILHPCFVFVGRLFFHAYFMASIAVRRLTLNNAICLASPSFFFLVPLLPLPRPGRPPLIILPTSAARYIERLVPPR